MDAVQELVPQISFWKDRCGTLNDRLSQKRRRESSEALESHDSGENAVEGIKLCTGGCSCRGICFDLIRRSDVQDLVYALVAGVRKHEDPLEVEEVALALLNCISNCCSPCDLLRRFHGEAHEILNTKRPQSPQASGIEDEIELDCLPIEVLSPETLECQYDAGVTGMRFIHSDEVNDTPSRQGDVDVGLEDPDDFWKSVSEAEQRLIETLDACIASDAETIPAIDLTGRVESGEAVKVDNGLSYSATACQATLENQRDHEQCHIEGDTISDQGDLPAPTVAIRDSDQRSCGWMGCSCLNFAQRQRNCVEMDTTMSLGSYEESYSTGVYGDYNPVNRNRFGMPLSFLTSSHGRFGRRGRFNETRRDWSDVETESTVLQSRRRPERLCATKAIRPHADSFDLEKCRSTRFPLTHLKAVKSSAPKEDRNKRRVVSVQMRDADENIDEPCEFCTLDIGDGAPIQLDCLCKY